jgi:non-specific serine/threonine protein kinase
MGVVYRAVQVRLDRTVAVKVISPELAADPVYRERFQREARLAASIEHPNVLPVYEAGRLDGDELYLVSRWVDGTDLRRLLVREDHLSPSRAIELLAPVALALDAAHARGLVHRDVKPANVLVAACERPLGDHVYLTDFGLARRVAEDRGLTRTGAFAGTVVYAAPERISGDPGGPAADIYALGCLLFEVLTGWQPFTRESEFATMQAHLNDPIPSMRDEGLELPAELDEVVRFAVAKDPADRFRSAGEMAIALDHALVSRNVTTTGLSTRGGTKSPADHETRPNFPTASSSSCVRRRDLLPPVTRPPAPAPGAARPPGADSPRRHNLPAVRTSFVGRTKELSAIEAALESSRVVTLTGVGGVGKTRLALEVAERTLEVWSGGVLLVELASVTGDSAVAEVVASGLRLSGPGGHDLLDAIVDRLDERQLLLVLDSCEHVLDACARLAALVARRRSLSRLLATSRAPLAIAGERVVPIAPLPTPVGIKGAELASVDAVRLFLERARQARPDFTAGPGDLLAIGDLCHRLDGIPLAIELAASRIRAMGPVEIVSRLERRLSLRGHERDREARHRSLEAMISWGHDLLAARPREVFRRVAVFPAPFSLRAAERVVGDPDVADAIVTLVDHSILVFVGELAQARYAMLDTVREFGLQRLADSGEAADTQAAYLDWAVDFVHEGMRHADGPQRAERLREVEVEHRNLVGALATPGSPDRRVPLACGLAELLSAGTSLREIHRLLEDVLAAASDADTPEVRRAGLLLGRSLRKLGELDRARAHLAAIAHQATVAGDRPFGASVAAEQALVEIKARRQDDAQRFLDESDRLGARRNQKVWSYRLLVEAQMRYELLGELSQARELYETCIAEVRRHGPTEHLIVALAALAELAVELDDLDTVETSAHEVLAIADPVADAYSRAGAVLALGRAALRRGHAGEAIAWLVQGARLDIERGSMEAPETLESLAQAVAESGAAAQSAALLGAAAAARARLGIGRLEREQVYVDAALAAIRRHLPEAELQRRMAQAAALTERELLALVDEAPAADAIAPPLVERRIPSD